MKGQGLDRLVLGTVLGLVLAGVGIFWWQGRAQVEQSAPPPPAPEEALGEDELPQADPADMRGPAPPEATELTREQRRFFRYDRNRDLKITRNEMLSLARSEGEIRTGSKEFEDRVGQMLQSIVATTEYLFA